MPRAASEVLVSAAAKRSATMPVSFSLRRCSYDIWVKTWVGMHIAYAVSRAGMRYCTATDNRPGKQA